MQQEVPGSPYTFSTPAQESTIYPKGFGSVYKRITETKIWEQNMVNVLRCFLSIYIHTYTFLSIHLSLIISSIFKILINLFFTVLGLHCCA